MESAILTIEGIFHQTGSTANVDIRSAYERYENSSNARINYLEEINADIVERTKMELSREFPPEVVERLIIFIMKAKQKEEPSSDRKTVSLLSRLTHT